MEYDISHLGLLDDDEIELDTAALELAALDHPGIDLDPYLDTLGDIAERVATIGAEAQTPHEQALALASAIGSEFSFEGDRNTYESSDNTDLIRVIDRRRGLPVSLTILYVAAARRLGWQAEALNTPGHVLGMIGDETDPVLIDPFASGAIVSPERLAELIGGILGPQIQLSPEHLTTMTNRAVLVRLLMNQASRAERNGNLKRALVLYCRMTTIAPSHVHAWWERARLEVADGEPSSARASLSAILEVTRDDDLRGHVYAALDALSGI